MKKLIVSACALAASVAAFATTVQSSNTFGVLKVHLRNAEATEDAEAAVNPAQYFIGVPWVKVGGGNINPTDLVLASKMNTGDMLYVYGAVSAGKFGAWTVTENETTKEKSWTGATVVDNSVIYDVASDTTPSVAQGSGVMVKTKVTDLYLSGQYLADDATAKTVAAKPADSSYPVYTLLSAKAAADSTLTFNGTLENPTPEKGDLLIVDGDITYTYKADGTTEKWMRPNGIMDAPPYLTQWSEVDSITLPKGRAAWYARKGTSALTVSFTVQ